jgi:BirA family biotin operon repressor/biotin-[acetyl-CoA-carboxylase] ligase
MSAWFQREFFDILRKERGVSWGEDLFLYDEVGSTNDAALHGVAAGAPTGSVWLARSQTSGRGRRGNVWHAAPGESMLMSCLLRYTGDAQRFLGLSLVVGLAVREIVRARISELASAEEPQIKWPNDVLVGGKKIAGVLVETRSASSSELGTVIGVGLNLSTMHFPPELPPATSLRLLGAQEGELRLEIILVEFLCALERMLGRFLEQGFLPFAAELASADYLQGKLVHVGRVEGRGAGFDSEGRLLLASSLGIVPVISGTVELL